MKAMGEMQWQCSICGAIRPDEFISVRQHDISHTNTPSLPKSTMIYNLKYCNDDKHCTMMSYHYKKSRRKVD